MENFENRSRMGSHGHTRTICTGNTVSHSGAFSALHLLRSYNLLTPSSELYRYDPYPIREYNFTESDVLQNSNTIESPSSPLTNSPLTAAFSVTGNILQSPFLTTAPPLIHAINVPQAFSSSTGNLMNRHLLTGNNATNLHRRPRSEKKPIPDEQKDEKYYERRKRNNQAAKKSRDARKIREDHIALRATMLEHENAILRAQIVTLREEAQSLRHMLIKQQTLTVQPAERSISSITSVPLSPSRSNPTATLDCQV